MTKINVDLSGSFSSEKKRALKILLNALSLADDGAFRVDYRGFNKDDSDEGNRLADKLLPLSQKECERAKSILFKYWRQLQSCKEEFELIYGKNSLENCRRKCGSHSSPSHFRQYNPVFEIDEPEFDEDSRDYCSLDDLDIPF